MLHAKAKKKQVYQSVQQDVGGAITILILAENYDLVPVYCGYTAIHQVQHLSLAVTLQVNEQVKARIKEAFEDYDRRQEQAHQS